MKPGDTVNVGGEPMVIVDITDEGDAILRELDDTQDIHPLSSMKVSVLEPW